MVSIAALESTLDGLEFPVREEIQLDGVRPVGKINTASAEGSILTGAP